MSIKRLKGKFRLSSSASVTSQLSIEDWTKYDDRLLECINKNDVTRLKHTLQKKGASPVKISIDGETALHVAVKKRMMTCVDVMLNENPDLAALDMQGRTVYHLAALNGDTIMLKKLLDYSRLNINRTDMNEMTALHYAVSSGESACVKLLLDSTSTIDYKELEGRTPLVLSIIEKQEKIALMLIDHGCNIDIADNSGRTPLVLAVSLGMCQVVAALLSKGADKNFADKEGRTLETIAKESKHPDVIKVLCLESEIEKLDNGFPDDKENIHEEDVFSTTNEEYSKTEENHVTPRARGYSSASTTSKRNSFLRSSEDHSFTSSIIESLRTLDSNSDTASQSSIPEHEIHEQEAEESKRFQDDIQRKELQIQELEAHVTSMTNKLRMEMELRYTAEKEVRQLLIQVEALMDNAQENDECEEEYENNDVENLYDEENIIHEEEDETENQEETEQELESEGGIQTEKDDEKKPDNNNNESSPEEMQDNDDNHSHSDESLDGELGYRKKSLGTAKQHIEMLEEHILTLEDDIANKDNEIGELEEQLSNTQLLVEFNNNTTISIDKFNEYKVESKLERNNLKEEIKKLEESISKFQTKITSLEGENKELKSSLEKNKQEINKTIADKEEEVKKNNKIKELEEENVKLKSTIKEELTSKEHLTNSLIVLEKEIEAFDESDERLKDLQIENHSLKSTIEVEMHKKELLEKDIENLEDQIKNYDGTLKEREKEYMDMICCYRENLLNAFQNTLDNRVAEALTRIAKLRTK